MVRFQGTKIVHFRGVSNLIEQKTQKVGSLIYRVDSTP